MFCYRPTTVAQMRLRKCCDSAQALSVAEGLRHKLDESNRGRYRKPSMPRLKAAMLTVSPMSCPVDPTQLSKVVGELGKIPKNQTNVIRPLFSIRYALWDEL